MKKYFMKGTEDEVQFGDMIELDLTEDMDNGHVKHHHLECKFLPEMVAMFLEEGVVEEVEDDEEESPLDFTDDCPMLQEVVKSHEALELEVEQLTKTVEQLAKDVAALVKAVAGNKKKN